MGVRVSLTVGEAIEAVRALLVAAADPRREADELFAAVVCGATSAAWLRRDEPIAEAERDRLMLAAQRRAAGWPQAYATGRANFRGHWLSVDQRVLIPRAETEGLVELVLEWVRGQSRVESRESRESVLDSQLSTLDSLPVVADIGTGSGAIAIALALEPGIGGVIATDLSADALNVALENATALGVKERISFRRGDLLIPLLGDPVDVVVSNPPYVASAEWAVLDPGVRNYEPRLALDGGTDGLDPYRPLVVQAREALNPGGLLALEVDAGRAAATAEVAEGAGFEDVAVRDDLFGLPRYVVGTQPRA
jgi:release factor glutamine methyltransferase